MSANSKCQLQATKLDISNDIGDWWYCWDTRRPGEKPFPVSCLAGSKLDRPAQLSCCWRLQKNCSQPTKIAQRKKCSRNLLTMSKFIVSKNLLNKFAHGESWIALHSTCNLSMDAWHNFYLHTNCSQQRKFAHSKEKLLTKSNLLRARICSKKLLTAEICSQNLLAA